MSKASELAYERIRALILSGELPPGEQLREEQLAQQCGVSRTPVREAFRRLETENFIYCNESQRRFVAESSIEEIKDAFELRAMLEAHAAKRAAHRINDRQLSELRRLNSRIGSAVNRAKPNVPAFLENNRLFHDTILEASASQRLTAMLASVVEQPVVMRTVLRYGPQNLQQAHSEHVELVSAFEARDPEWAAAVMTSHIRRALYTYLDASQPKQKTRSANIAA